MSPNVVGPAMGYQKKYLTSREVAIGPVGITV